MSLYGTRDAGLNWSIEVAETMKSLGFGRGEASACNYRHRSRGIDLTVHGDDFLIVASTEDLEWTIREVAKKFEIKSSIQSSSIEPSSGQEEELSIWRMRNTSS